MKWYMVQGCVKHWDVVLCVVRGFGKNNSTCVLCFLVEGYGTGVWDMITQYDVVCFVIQEYGMGYRNIVAWYGARL